MLYLVFLALASAEAYQDAVDAALGFPKPGENVGEGVHADPVISTTLHYADILAHQSKALWAFPVDATVAALGLSNGGGTESSGLTGWFPSPFGVDA